MLAVVGPTCCGQTSYIGKTAHAGTGLRGQMRGILRAGSPATGSMIPCQRASCTTTPQPGIALALG